ncbi:hypothetical protein SDC9_153905 [bioreactor metagenome]|uniref:Uncharacterized protein n=1 Tax=bioreactor metagenome TaxID=1076179 RepID=A0A645EZN5_9ZZZZ
MRVGTVAFTCIYDKIPIVPSSNSAVSAALFQDAIHVHKEFRHETKNLCFGRRCLHASSGSRLRQRRRDAGLANTGGAPKRDAGIHALRSGENRRRNRGGTPNADSGISGGGRC